MGLHFTLGLESQWYSTRNWVAAILYRTVATVFIMLLELGQKMLGIVVYWEQNSSKSKLNLPPGPKAYPVIGSLPSLGPNPHQTVAELTQKYGPLVFLKLGTLPAVVTHDPDVVTSIMHDQVFQSRPQTVCGHFLTYGGRDFVMAPPGDRWRALRKICVMELLSNKRMEAFAGLRQAEVAALVTSVETVGESGRLAVEIRGMVEKYSMNILTGMVLGKKYFGTHHDATHAAGGGGGHNVDDNNSEVARLLMDSFHYFGVFNISDFIPWLAPLDLQGHLRNAKKV
jgi:hypothetical protein